MPKREYSIDEKLRSYLTFELVKKISGFGRMKLSLHGDKDPGSRIAYPWDARAVVPEDDSLRQFQDVAPAAVEFMECAPFRLLADTPLSVEEIDELISVYRHQADALPYRFPVKSPITDISYWESPCEKNDSATLARRGDIYGFFAIVALVREAEAMRNDQSHLFHIRSLCQCLPLLGRFDWQRRDFGLINAAVKTLRNRVDNTTSRVGVYWDRIGDCFWDPTKRPNMLVDPVDPNSLLPAALPNMTYIVTATDIGEPPPWPTSNSVSVSEGDLMALKDISYDIALSVCADKSLLLTFANIAGLWELPGQVCAACLDIEPGDLSPLLSEDSISLTDRLKTRIAVTLGLLDHLGQEATSIDDCGYILRRPKVELQSRSVLSLLTEGRLIDVAEALGVNELRAVQNNEFCFVAISNIRATL